MLSLSHLTMMGDNVGALLQLMTKLGPIRDVTTLSSNIVDDAMIAIDVEAITQPHLGEAFSSTW